MAEQDKEKAMNASLEVGSQIIEATETIIKNVSTEVSLMALASVSAYFLSVVLKEMREEKHEETLMFFLKGVHPEFAKKLEH